jgi:hypothetical protein
VINKKEPEQELEPEPELKPQFVISTPAPAAGGNLISAPQLSATAPQHCEIHLSNHLQFRKSEIMSTSQVPLHLYIYTRHFFKQIT